MSLVAAMVDTDCWRGNSIDTPGTVVALTADGAVDRPVPIVAINTTATTAMVVPPAKTSARNTEAPLGSSTKLGVESSDGCRHVRS
jgi:hypothetical protein